MDIAIPLCSALAVGLATASVAFTVIVPLLLGLIGNRRCD